MRLLSIVGAYVSLRNTRHIFELAGSGHSSLPRVEGGGEADG